MNPNTIQKFDSVKDLHGYIEKVITDLNKKISEYSDIVGRKIRDSNESFQDDAAFQEIKEKIEGKEDPKKKKKQKKGQNPFWFIVEDVKIFDGVGERGEIEIYFKAIENLKSELERHEKIKSSLDSLLSKGLKEDMPVLVCSQANDEFEMVFLNKSKGRKKFQFKSSFQVNIQKPTAQA